MKHFDLPSASAKYISLQRLETQALGSSIHYTALGTIAYRIYEHIPFAKAAFRYYSANLEPQIRAPRIIALYNDVMAREFSIIRPYIGTHLNSIVGIGSGMAGLEILISHHCRVNSMPTPHIILIDKTGIGPIQYGFHQVAAVYNSLDLAREGLIQNGHPANKVETVDAEKAHSLTQRLCGSVDLITSLIAWGFHFPVDTYLTFSRRVLAPAGRLIIDVRKGTDGLAKLRTAFNEIVTIYDDPKFDRVLASQVVTSNHE